MNEIGYFKMFVFCTGDVIVDIDHLHIKRIHLVNFLYIIVEDICMVICWGWFSYVLSWVCCPLLLYTCVGCI
jgi:hypothetical protein